MQTSGILTFISTDEGSGLNFPIWENKSSCWHLEWGSICLLPPSQYGPNPDTSYIITDFSLSYSSTALGTLHFQTQSQQGSQGPETFYEALPVKESLAEGRA